MTDHRPIRRALISVSDKTGVVDFAKGLIEHDVEIVSTGGTAVALRNAGLTIRDISELTAFPEIMDGRVKTLHPKVHGGLLAVRSDEGHRAALSEHGIEEIDLLAVNLYPFEQTVERGASYDECVENIDIGGPAMVRAASKNHEFVSVLTDPGDYRALLDSLADSGGVSLEMRRRLAGKAYAMTAAYDAAVSAWFSKQNGEEFPETVTISGRRKEVLRYGENSHQKAAFYSSGEERPGVSTATQLQGKALSYNNLNDTDAAFELISEFGPQTPAVAIIKHANPCGAAIADDAVSAYKLALRCDPVSAFGGIVATNQKLSGSLAAEITKVFTEVVIAPDADDEAKAIFAAKKNLRLLLSGDLSAPTAEGVFFKSLAGGFLLQSRDNGVVKRENLEIVTKRAPSEDELDDMLFAFRVAKHVKSNAIVYAKDGATVGIGAGQMSRLDSSRIASHKAEYATKAAKVPDLLTKDCVVASDAFFPFADGLLAAVEAGARAVIQPGGSMRDNEVIAAADEAGIAMAFTNIRHFRH